MKLDGISRCPPRMLSDSCQLCTVAEAVTIALCCCSCYNRSLLLLLQLLESLSVAAVSSSHSSLFIINILLDDNSTPPTIPPLPSLHPGVAQGVEGTVIEAFLPLRERFLPLNTLLLYCISTYSSVSRIEE